VLTPRTRRRARHPSSDQLSRSPAGARSDIRAQSPGVNSAHLPAATRYRVCRMADPLKLIRTRRSSCADVVSPQGARNCRQRKAACPWRGRWLRRCRWPPQAAHPPRATDRPLWTRTIKRAVRHERLLAIKAYRGVNPLFLLIFEIRYYIGSREAAMIQVLLPPANLWGIVGILDWLTPPMLCRTPALPTISAGQRANGVSARREVFTFGIDLRGFGPCLDPPTG
jgi:hypothetical protein